ncbi:MAG TPA: right-handed parallel beta-helix repeat-containing protein, partial [Acidobacteriota bacterium]|nr:right-handed parallel beta-helix repeat-containing protein [Acidobacteriota bacterium]
DWASLHDAEFVVLHYWCDARLPQPVRDPRTGWISCARRSNLRLLEAWDAKPARYYLDNLAEALTEPGEWYFDRGTAELRYLPVPGETPANTEAVAAHLLTLVDVRGETFVESKEAARAETTRLVCDVRFDGIEFAFSDWQQSAPQSFAHDRVDLGGVPAAGSPQAASSVPGAVRFRHAHDCAVTGCTFRHLGHYALEFGSGCWGSRMQRCTIEDVGAGGVKVDGADLDGAAADRTGKIEITDNTIHAIGRVFHQGVGVLVTSAQACTIARNHIHDTLYTAISVGWSWGYRPTISRDNFIVDNHLHDIGQGLLSDMGAVYLLGVQPGTVVRHNRIHHVRAHNYGAWGLYLDEGASHVVVERNLVHDTQGACLNIHYGRENLIRHNVFVRGGEALVCLGKIEAHIAATLHGNVLMGPTRQIYIGGYEGDVTEAGRGLAADQNIFWAPRGVLRIGGNPSYRGPQVPTSTTLRQWRKSGRDRLSRRVRPQLQESKGWTSGGNEKLGVPSLKWSDCGPNY